MFQSISFGVYSASIFIKISQLAYLSVIPTYLRCATSKTKPIQFNPDYHQPTPFQPNPAQSNPISRIQQWAPASANKPPPTHTRSPATPALAPSPVSETQHPAARERRSRCIAWRPGGSRSLLSILRLCGRGGWRWRVCRRCRG